MLDTGASVNIIRSNVLNKIGYSHVNFKDNISLTGINNTCNETMGSVIIELLIGNTIFSTKFYVMKNLPVPGIIGAEFLKRHTLFIDKNFNFIVLQKPRLYFNNHYNKNEENLADINCEEISTSSDDENDGNEENANIIAYCENNAQTYEIHNSPQSNFDDELCIPKELNLDIDKDCDVIEYKKFKYVCGEERLKKLLETINLKHLNNENHDAIVFMIRKFNKLFFLEGDELTFTNAAIHEIETTTNIPINKRQYRMPESTKTHIDEQIEEMLKLGIIQPSKSPWNAPVLCIPKKVGADGKKKYRIVVDFRALNLITKPFVFPIPLINEILDNIGDAQYFSSIDLKSGFYQILIHPKDAAKTAFSTWKGHYEFFKNAYGSQK